MEELRRIAKRLTEENASAEEIYQRLFVSLIFQKSGYEKAQVKRETDHTEPEVIKIAVCDRTAPMLLAVCTSQERLEKYTAGLLLRLEQTGTGYGLLVNARRLLLIHKDIPVLKDEPVAGWKHGKTVLEIIFNGRRNVKYWKYLSYKEMFLTENINYFRDIAEYQNVAYTGSRASWGAYETALKGFVDYLASNKYIYSDYKNTTPYQAVTPEDYIAFMESKQKKKKPGSPYTLENGFSYIKGFLLFKAPQNKSLQIERKKLLEAFPWSGTKELGNILDQEHIYRVDIYLKNQRNGIRNRCLFYLLLFYGLERSRLMELTWDNFDFEGKRIRIDGKENPLPDNLARILLKLKEENERSGRKGNYLFYGHKKGEGRCLRDSAVNDVFAGIENVDKNDEIYRQYAPQHIRKSLVRYLLAQGNCSLEEIIYLLDIDIENLKNYLTNRELEEIIKGRERKHPLEKMNIFPEKES